MYASCWYIAAVLVLDGILHSIELVTRTVQCRQPDTATIIEQLIQQALFTTSLCLKSAAYSCFWIQRFFEEFGWASGSTQTVLTFCIVRHACGKVHHALLANAT